MSAKSKAGLGNAANSGLGVASANPRNEGGGNVAASSNGTPYSHDSPNPNDGTGALDNAATKRWSSPVFRQHLNALDNTATRSGSLTTLKQHVQHMEPEAIPRLLHHVEETDEEGSTRRFAVSLYEDCARVHGPRLIPFLPQLMASTVQILASPASSDLLHLACARALLEIATQCGATEEQFAEVMHHLCEPLASSLSNRFSPLAAGAALCLRSLVTFHKWDQAPNSVKDLVFKRTVKAVGDSRHLLQQLQLACDLIPANPLMVKFHARALLKAAEETLVGPTSWKQRFYAIRIVQEVVSRCSGPSVQSESRKLLAILVDLQSDKTSNIKQEAIRAVKMLREIGVIPVKQSPMSTPSARPSYRAAQDSFASATSASMSASNYYIPESFLTTPSSPDQTKRSLNFGFTPLSPPSSSASPATPLFSRFGVMASESAAASADRLLPPGTNQPATSASNKHSTSTSKQGITPTKRPFALAAAYRLTPPSAANGGKRTERFTNGDQPAGNQPSILTSASSVHPDAGLAFDDAEHVSADVARADLASDGKDGSDVESNPSLSNRTSSDTSVASTSTIHAGLISPVGTTAPAAGRGGQPLVAETEVPHDAEEEGRNEGGEESEAGGEAGRSLMPLTAAAGEMSAAEGTGPGESEAEGLVPVAEADAAGGREGAANAAEDLGGGKGGQGVNSEGQPADGRGEGNGDACEEQVIVPANDLAATEGGAENGDGSDTIVATDLEGRDGGERGSGREGANEREWADENGGADVREGEIEGEGGFSKADDSGNSLESDIEAVKSFVGSALELKRFAADPPLTPVPAETGNHSNDETKTEQQQQQQQQQQLVLDGFHLLKTPEEKSSPSLAVVTPMGSVRFSPSQGQAASPSPSGSSTASSARKDVLEMLNAVKERRSRSPPQAKRRAPVISSQKTLSAPAASSPRSLLLSLQSKSAVGSNTPSVINRILSEHSVQSRTAIDRILQSNFEPVLQPSFEPILQRSINGMLGLGGHLPLAGSFPAVVSRTNQTRGFNEGWRRVQDNPIALMVDEEDEQSESDVAFEAVQNERPLSANDGEISTAPPVESILFEEAQDFGPNDDAVEGAFVKGEVHGIDRIAPKEDEERVRGRMGPLPSVSSRDRLLAGGRHDQGGESSHTLDVDHVAGVEVDFANGHIEKNLEDAKILQVQQKETIVRWVLKCGKYFITAMLIALIASLASIVVSKLGELDDECVDVPPT